MKASASTWSAPWKSALPAPDSANVECMDGGTGGFTLLGAAAERQPHHPDRRCRDGNPEGTVTRTTPRFSRDYPPTLTAHDIGVKDLLDVFYIQGGPGSHAITIDPHEQPIGRGILAEARLTKSPHPCAPRKGGQIRTCTASGLADSLVSSA
jgi:hypothetical protein